MTGSAIEYKDKAFSVHEGIPLPADTVHKVWRKSDDDDARHLFLSPAKASYIVTDDVGARLVWRLRDGETLLEAHEGTRRELDLPTEEISASLSQVLQRIELQGFRGDAEPVEDTPTEFPVLCYLTKLCNLRCKHCYVAAGPGRGTRSDMTTEEWQRMISGFADYMDTRPGLRGRLTLTGGEALTRKDVFEIAGHAKERGIFVELFTNATRIRNAAVAQRLAETVDAVQVSLDGATAPVNDFIRGEGVHRRVVRAIELLAEEGVPVTLAVTLMPFNAEDIEHRLIDLQDLILKNVPKVRIGLANVLGRADDSMTFSDALEGERALSRILAGLYSRGLRRPRRITKNFRNVDCGYGRSMSVASDGTVYGCAIETRPLGNVRTDDFAALAEQLAELAASCEVDNIPGCQSCDLRYFCNGGCRLNNYTRKGDLQRTCCNRRAKDKVFERMVFLQTEDNPTVALPV